MTQEKKTPETAKENENKEYAVHVHLEGITHDAEGHHVRPDGTVVEFDHDHDHEHGDCGHDHESR